MKILITGASSGIGLDMARYLATQKHELILVARDKERLEEVQQQLKTIVTIIVADLSNEQKVKELYVLLKKENIDVLINNAGFGACGYFTEADLNNELDSGYILNVASSAAFQPGPLMSTYYATKSYVYQLTAGIYYEQKKKKSNVNISVLCPGPTATNFLKDANVKFAIKPLSSEFVAKYAIDKMFAKKMLIIPGFKMKCAKFLGRFAPDKLLLKIIYRIQKRKVN